MKFQGNILLSLVLVALPVGAFSQCSNANLKPVWDAEKSQFRCSGQMASGEKQKDEAVQATGDKKSCAAVRANLEAECPQGNDGKACRSEAKSIYNSCYKRPGSDSDAASSSSASGAKTDSATCMTTFQQQQQACNTRKMQPVAPGQPVPQDTCLQDAMAEQRKCLANSR